MQILEKSFQVQDGVSSITFGDDDDIEIDFGGDLLTAALEDYINERRS